MKTEDYPSVVAVVLNWNQVELTITCLESLYSQEKINLQLVVVDNGSTDRSARILRERFSGINIIENAYNMGFAGGFNVGISYALKLGVENLFLVNNDTFADPLMLRILVENMQPGVGILSPAIYYASAPDKLWSVGGMINPLLLEIVDFHMHGLSIPAPVIERDFLPSCAWLVRREVFEKIGLLDERFFPIYYDDLDFCLRTRRAGFRILLVRDARLWHKVAQSSGGEHKPRERYLMARNGAYYFRKNMRWWQFPFIILYRMGSTLLWTLRLLIKPDIEALRAYLKGLLDGWLGAAPGEK